MKLFLLDYGPIGAVVENPPTGVVCLAVWVVALSLEEALRKGNERIFSEMGAVLPLFRWEERQVGHYFFDRLEGRVQ